MLWPAKAKELRKYNSLSTEEFFFLPVFCNLLSLSHLSLLRLASLSLSSLSCTVSTLLHIVTFLRSFFIYHCRFAVCLFSFPSLCLISSINLWVPFVLPSFQSVLSPCHLNFIPFCFLSRVFNVIPKFQP